LPENPAVVIAHAEIMGDRWEPSLEPPLLFLVGGFRESRPPPGGKMRADLLY
jgi:hypothetical protein